MAPNLMKDRFIIVDAVGVCEQDKTDSHTLNREPSKTLEQVLEYVAQDGTDPEALTTLAGRLARLQREFSPDRLAELKDLAGGRSFPVLAADLFNACDRDTQIAKAKELFGEPGHPGDIPARGSLHTRTNSPRCKCSTPARAPYAYPSGTCGS